MNIVDNLCEKIKVKIKIKEHKKVPSRKKENKKKNWFNWFLFYWYRFVWLTALSTLYANPVYEAVMFLFIDYIFPNANIVCLAFDIIYLYTILFIK